MSEDQDAPDSNLLTPFGQGLRWCDACLLNIDTGSTYFYCEICNGGRFGICSACSKIEIKWPVVSHHLVRYVTTPTSEEGGWEAGFLHELA